MGNERYDKMTTTKNTDRAAAKTYGAGELMRMSHDDKIEIIQRLQSEHAALVAVAEAAKRVGLPNESDGAQGFKTLGTALAKLAAVRGESEGGK